MGEEEEEYRGYDTSEPLSEKHSFRNKKIPRENEILAKRLNNAVYFTEIQVVSFFMSLIVERDETTLCFDINIITFGWDLHEAISENA